MSKNWTLKNIIGLGLNFTYDFEVCYIKYLHLQYILQPSSQPTRLPSNQQAVTNWRNYIFWESLLLVWFLVNEA